jgi:hypothetical protein
VVSQYVIPPVLGINIHSSTTGRNAFQLLTASVNKQLEKIKDTWHVDIKSVQFDSCARDALSAMFHFFIGGRGCSILALLYEFIPYNINILLLLTL